MKSETKIYQNPERKQSFVRGKLYQAPAGNDLSVSTDSERSASQSTSGSASPWNRPENKVLNTREVSDECETSGRPSRIARWQPRRRHLFLFPDAVIGSQVKHRIVVAEVRRGRSPTPCDDRQTRFLPQRAREETQLHHLRRRNRR